MSFAEPDSNLNGIKRLQTLLRQIETEKALSAFELIKSAIPRSDGDFIGPHPLYTWEDSVFHAINAVRTISAASDTYCKYAKLPDQIKELIQDAGQLKRAVTMVRDKLSEWVLEEDKRSQYGEALAEIDTFWNRLNGVVAEFVHRSKHHGLG